MKGEEGVRPDMVGRMEPMVQGHTADMVAQVAQVVQMARVGELEAGIGCQIGGGTRLITFAEKYHLIPFLGTYQWMCGLVGVDVVRVYSNDGKIKWNGRERGCEGC